MAQHLKYGEFDLTWNYNPPFALGRTVTQPITSGENPVDYRGTAETPCIIVFCCQSKYKAILKSRSFTATTRTHP